MFSHQDAVFLTHTVNVIDHYRDATGIMRTDPVAIYMPARPILCGLDTSGPDFNTFCDTYNVSYEPLAGWYHESEKFDRNGNPIKPPPPYVKLMGNQARINQTQTGKQHDQRYRHAKQHQINHKPGTQRIRRFR